MTTLLDSLRNLFSNILNNESIINLLFSKKYENIWKKAFTDKSIDVKNNNETYQFIGNSLLKTIFPKYLTLKYPELEQGLYTNINSKYNSKIVHQELLTKINLYKYVLADDILLQNSATEIYSSAYEAIYGAIIEVADDIKFGLGFIIAYNLLVYLYQDIKINIVNCYPYRTEVEQIFARTEYKKKPVNVYHSNKYFVSSIYNNDIPNLINPIATIKETNKKEFDDKLYQQAYETLEKYGIVQMKYEKDKTPRNTIATITLTDLQIQFLQKYIPEFNHKIIGTGNGYSKKEAKKNAYREAYDLLYSYNLYNPEVLENIKIDNLENHE